MKDLKKNSSENTESYRTECWGPSTLRHCAHPVNTHPEWTSLYTNRNPSIERVALDDGDVGWCFRHFFRRMTLDHLLDELLECSEVALALPRVVVRPIWENGQSLSPGGGQLVELLHHHGRNQLVREARDEERRHPALGDLPVGQKLIFIAP